MCPIPRLVLLFALLVPWAMSWALPPRVAVITMLDGDAGLLRDGSKLTLAEGVGLQAGDILTTGPKTRLLRIEYPDSLSIAFGPDSQALLTPHLGADSSHAAIYLLRGWAKLSAPKAIASGVLSPVADAGTTGGTMIVALQPGGAQLFAESGQVLVQMHGADAGVQTLKPDEMLALAPGSTKPVLSTGPTTDFVKTMPRTFMDSLPSHAAQFEGRDVEATKVGAMTYADAQPWLDSEIALRRVFVKRWRSLASNADFRRGLIAGLKAHPEWTPILFPPPPPPPPVPKAAPGGKPTS